MTGQALVIGAGAGGLAAAARLVQAGFQVTVLETQARVGGKCGSLRHQGFTVDIAPHVFSCSHAGELGKAAQLLGEQPEFVIKNPVGRVCLGSRSFPLPSRFADLAGLARLGLSLGVQPKNLPGVLRHFAKLCFPAEELAGRLTRWTERVTERTSPVKPTRVLGPWEKAPFDQSLRDWALADTDDRAYHLFLGLCSILAFVIPYDQASAGEFQACIRRMVKGPGIGYPRGGCQELMDTLARGLSRNGVSLRLGERVERIHVEKGRVRGVFTRRGFLQADAVYFNGGVNALYSLLDRDSQSLLRSKPQTSSLGTVTVTYLLNKPVVSEPIVLGYPDGDPADICTRIREERFSELCRDGFYIVVPTNFDPALAPRGKQIVLAGTLFPADVSKVSHQEEAVRALEAGLLRRFPGLFDAVFHRRVSGPRFVSAVSGRPGMGEAVGAAQCVGQCGDHRPRHEGGIAGLFVVGADTGRGAIGTELAAQSGLSIPLVDDAALISSRA